MNAKTTPPDQTKPPRKKATKAEVLQRVEETMLIRLSGAGFHDLREYAREKQWDVSESQLYRYMQQADDRIADSLAKDRPRLLDLHIARRRMLFARCVDSGDWRAALAVLRDEALLYRLYDQAKASPDEATNPANDTPEAALARLKAGAARAAAQADALLRSDSEATRLAAARTLLDACLRYREQGELAARVEMLEAVLKQRQGDKGR
jgi:hypothetical protein